MLHRLFMGQKSFDNQIKSIHTRLNQMSQVLDKLNTRIGDLQAKHDLLHAKESGKVAGTVEAIISKVRSQV